MANEQRLIDANEIVKVAEHAYHEWNLAMAAADGQRQINRVYKMQELCKAVKTVAAATPTVDAVEVVRCKDCKQWCRNVGFTDSPNGHCFYHDIETNGHDFCSYGERRDNEKE